MSHASTENTLTILIVDDDRDDHEFLNMAINKVMPGSRVISVFDGSQAMEYLKENKNSSDKLPDLVFLDINMHKVDGRITTQLIRKDPFFNQLPVIILSTSKSPEDEEELLELGANGFYAKQFHIQGLVEIIKEVSSKFLVSQSL